MYSSNGSLPGSFVLAEVVMFPKLPHEISNSTTCLFRYVIVCLKEKYVNETNHLHCLVNKLPY